MIFPLLIVSALSSVRGDGSFSGYSNQFSSSGSYSSGSACMFSPVFNGVRFHHCRGCGHGANCDFDDSFLSKERCSTRCFNGVFSAAVCGSQRSYSLLENSKNFANDDDEDDRQYSTWGLSQWSNDQPCSSVCGAGYRFSKRSVKSPVSSWRGPSPCLSRTIPCSSCCATQGNWTYTQWSAWSQSCGTATRSRAVVSCIGASCGGSCGTQDILTQTQTSCCPQAGINTFSSWSAWTGTCGTVARSRLVTGCTATCGAFCYPPALIDLMQSRSLSPCCLPVSGNWTYSDWSAWSATCGTATRIRTTLACLGASCGGSCDCPTASELQQSQVLAPCCTISAYGIVPVSNWIVSDWSSWSGTCGNVTRTRNTILCNQPPCSSPCTPLPASALTQIKVLTPCCPDVIQWLYSSWSSWSATCGNAVRTRVTVACTGSVCGVQCTDATVLTQSQTTCCPTSGEWRYYDWSAWSSNCGNATRSRVALVCQSSTCGGICAPPVTMETRQSAEAAWNYGSWSAWSTTCASGYRFRALLNCTCAGGCHLLTPVLTDSRLVTNCPSNNQNWTYSQWSEWSTTCGQAVRARQALSCPNSELSLCGPAFTIQNRTICCPIHGQHQYSSWSDWTSTCGEGWRTREILGCNATCGGSCGCREHIEYRNVQCTPPGHWVYTSWGAWSATCGTAARKRFTISCVANVDNDEEDDHPANLMPARCESPITIQTRTVCCPAIGSWSAWSAFTACQVVYGVATQQQQRVCLNAQCGGSCVGESFQTVPCTPVTIVDCRVGSWRNVSECSASCGVGLQRQARDILINPENGGLPCSTLQQVVQCFQRPCDLPCIVGPWENIGVCSVTCGLGYQSQYRSIIQRPTGQYSCPSATQVVECRQLNCPDDCVLSEWVDFSACSNFCSGGKKSQIRWFIRRNGSGLSCQANLTRVVDCADTNKCSQDCVVSEWASVGEPSGSCDSGLQEQVRFILSPSLNGGRLCPPQSRQIQVSLRNCSIDCQLSEWSSTPCSATCGTGVQTRIRNILQQPAYGGANCAHLQEIVPCQVQPCADFCDVSQWAASSTCTSLCNGTQYQIRTIVAATVRGIYLCPSLERTVSCGDPSSCRRVDCLVGPWVNDSSSCCTTGSILQRRSILREAAYGGLACPALEQNVPCADKSSCPCSENQCVYSSWSNLLCSATCGSGFTYHTRTVLSKPCPSAYCLQVFEIAGACNQLPCAIDCQVSSWVDVTPCSTTCGAGVKLQRRAVLVNAESGGVNCPSLVQEIPCSTPCARDCQVSGWGNSGPCSSTCGSGIQPQTRVVLVQASSGGASCPVLSRNITCSQLSGCPIDCEVSQWVNSDCSSSCNGGSMIRSRQIIRTPSYGGLGCLALEQEAFCNPQPCPRDCVVSSWAAVTSCSQTCGAGFQNLRRTVLVPSAYGGLACPTTLTQLSSCNLSPCASDCQVSQWVGSSPCSLSCGGGVQAQSRAILTPAVGNGTACPILQRTVPCSPSYCPVDCIVSQWLSFGPDQTCGTSTVTATRRVLQASSNGGMACPALQKTALSILPPCPQDCVVTDWADFDPCSTSCSTGTKPQSRSIILTPVDGGAPCPSTLFRTEPCTLQGCPTDCVYSSWQNVGECSASCGGGYQVQTRSAIGTSATVAACLINVTLNQIIPCNTQMCTQPCIVSGWTPGLCSVSCGTGVQTQYRTILQQPIGGDCPVLSMSTSCDAGPCPSDCQVSNWASGLCTASCGVGFLTQNRTILVPSVGGGTACPPNLEQTIMCSNLPPCPQDCVVGPWYDFTSCNNSCGAGYQVQFRDVLRPAAFGGIPCPPQAQTAQCLSNTPCTQDCVVGPWIEDDCSASCNGGWRIRHRYVVQYPIGSGRQCPQLVETTIPCNTQPCPIDCVLSDPLIATICSPTNSTVYSPTSCGLGSFGVVQFVATQPSFGGAQCPAHPPALQACWNDGGCTSNDCQLSQWSNFGGCSASCGPGIQLQRRPVFREASNGGVPCPSVPIERTLTCNLFQCPVHCLVSDWTFGNCSQYCGTGTRVLVRNVLQYPSSNGIQCPSLWTEQDCGTNRSIICPAAPVFGQWSNFGQCSVSCGVGFVRQILPLTQAPVGSTIPLEDYSRFVTCFAGECPIDCVVSDWFTTGSCNASCGNGFLTQSRIVLQPAFGVGQSCPTPLARYAPCNIHSCPGQCTVSAWQQSDCSVTCGSGFITLVRTITSTGISDPNSCPSLQETIPCTRPACPLLVVDCEVSAWFNSGDCIAPNCNSVGYQLEVVSVLRYPENGGRPCNSTARYIPCTPSCSDDCVVSHWVTQQCSVSCGTGYTSRSRMIVQAPSGSGRVCPSLFESGIPCSKPACPSFDCVVSDWTFGLCDANCLMTQTRSILYPPIGNGSSCPVLSLSNVPCASSCTPAIATCQFTEWQNDGICTVPCGGVGTVRQIRFIKYSSAGLNSNLLFGCGPLERIAPCYGGQCGASQCVLSDWSNVGESCSVSCGVGVGILTRTVLIPSVNGAPCGNLTTFAACHRPSCVAYQPVTYCRLSQVVIDNYLPVITSATVEWSPAAGSGLIQYEIYLSVAQNGRREEPNQVFFANVSLDSSSLKISRLDYSVFDMLYVYVRFADGLGANPGFVKLSQQGASGESPNNDTGSSSGSLSTFPIIMAVFAFILIVIAIIVIVIYRRNRRKDNLLVEETDAIDTDSVPNPSRLKLGDSDPGAAFAANRGNSHLQVRAGGAFASLTRSYVPSETIRSIESNTDDNFTLHGESSVVNPLFRPSFSQHSYEPVKRPQFSPPKYEVMKGAKSFPHVYDTPIPRKHVTYASSQAPVQSYTPMSPVTSLRKADKTDFSMQGQDPSGDFIDDVPSFSSDGWPNAPPVEQLTIISLPTPAASLEAETLEEMEAIILTPLAVTSGCVSDLIQKAFATYSEIASPTLLDIKRQVLLVQSPSIISPEPAEQFYAKLHQARSVKHKKPMESMALQATIMEAPTNA